MKINKYLPLVLLFPLLSSCGNKTGQADAYGNFEADEIIVSSEATGKLLGLSAEEGVELDSGQVVGAIDSIQLVLKREQLRASIRAVIAKQPIIGEQLEVYERQLAASKQQLATLEREKRRVESLLKNDAATPKQLDDLNAQIDQLQRQMDVIRTQREATNVNLNTQRGGLLAEVLPLQVQIEQLDDQIARCRVVNPAIGVVLSRYAEPGEIVPYAKPLYKLADIRTITLRAYISAEQLGNVRLGQQVTVRVDGPDGGYIEHQGKVRWIASKAEFTPKVIQTKSERTNLVYAIKVSVPNDGSLKIGMPGEIVLGLK